MGYSYRNPNSEQRILQTETDATVGHPSCISGSGGLYSWHTFDLLMSIEHCLNCNSLQLPVSITLHHSAILELSLPAESMN